MTRVGRSSVADVLMKVVFYMILVLFGFMCAYPFLNMIAVSLSSPAYVVANKVFIFPVHIQMPTTGFW
jgi:ABC-type glycerol-3-phosphate transport system permease component